jgi:hypothetical protein
MRDDRFLTIAVGGLVAYAFFEMGREYVKERRQKWVAWYSSFTEPFNRNPGRREWLRETLTREELTVRSAD